MNKRPVNVYRPLSCLHFASENMGFEWVKQSLDLKEAIGAYTTIAPKSSVGLKTAKMPSMMPTKLGMKVQLKIRYNKPIQKRPAQNLWMPNEPNNKAMAMYKALLQVCGYWAA